MAESEFLFRCYSEPGFSGIIPAYVLAVRELFPASEASWRVPTLLLFSGSGMAFGGWLAGAIYDYAGFYAIALGIAGRGRVRHWPWPTQQRRRLGGNRPTGILFNLVHLTLIGSLVPLVRLRRLQIDLSPRRHDYTPE